MLKRAFDTFYIFFDFRARNHNLVTAFFAADFEIHTNAQHDETAASAMVIFFADNHVADLNIHIAASFHTKNSPENIFKIISH